MFSEWSDTGSLVGNRLGLIGTLVAKDSLVEAVVVSLRQSVRGGALGEGADPCVDANEYGWVARMMVLDLQ